MKQGEISWAYLILAVGANAFANIALKKLALAAQEGKSFLDLLQSIWFPSATVACFCLLAFYVLALREIPVAIAYAVVTGGSLVVIIVLSAVVLGASFNTTQWIAAALILVGLALLRIG